MERNIKVARAHRALSWLYGFVFITIVALAIFDARARTAAVVFPAAIFAVVFTIHHVTYKGAMEGKPWARIVSIIISVLLLLGFPIGTLIGLYLLANTWKPWSHQSSAGVVA